MTGRGMLSTAILVAAVSSVPLQGLAQHLRPTEASDRVFEALERLQAFGVLDTIPMGQRVGLERALREALGSSTDSSSSRLAELDRLIHRPAMAASLEFSSGWADVQSRVIPDNGTSGRIDATLAPLVQQRGGRRLGDGFNLTLEPGLEAHSGDWMVQLRTRLRWLRRDGTKFAEGRVQELWVEGPLGPLYLSLGRAPVVWGLSPSGGSMLAGEARAMDQVTFASDGTFRLPWLFRHYGPARFSLSIARLEGARDIPHSFLVGYKLSVKPAKSLEVGVGVLNHSWGEGAPSASLGRRILDYLVIPERFTDSPESQISNVLVGLDIRWRVPGTRGSQAYGSITLDDFGHNPELRRVFGDNATYIVGLTIPRVADRGGVSAHAEFRYTGITPYRHSRFSSGLTLDEIIMGDPLGPNGRGVYLTVAARPTIGDRLSFRVARERRSGDLYNAPRGSDGFVFFLKVSDLPEEWRTRVEVNWERAWPAGSLTNMTTLVRAGYEHVSDFGFEAGVRQSGAFFELRASVRVAQDR